ncbi:hypothetical protein IGI04_015996 [Brassica rapa subsp. trilocularis]|uniref:Ubiquitin-like protease family profile domain-containing protein n=1 Tax=Brassica rapa subsp. trilocularis TaxID=1813537 RepID=A0ABQ7MRQ3_BRACM|nr:hypothetical protein IGI04_015996 [Brassica rapa subsp. trilocularis]
MVSARLVDCSEEPEEPDMQKIPEMMFAAGEEPVGVRILIYQSSTAPQRILNALDEEELVMVAAVPALTEVVQDSYSSSDSDSEDIDGSGRDIFTKKRTLNPAHARNLDKRTDFIVHSILVQDPERPIDEAILVRHDEVHDSRVDNLVEAVRRNYQFNNSCFRGGIRKIDVVHMREKVKSSAKCKRAKKGITTSSEAENSVIVDLVLDKIKPQIDVLESNIKIGSSRVDAIEGGVRKQVETLLSKFKGEMLSSLKDIVSEVCKDHLAAHKGPGNYQPSSPTNLFVPGCHTSHVADANAKTIENVLRDISQYSTPPRSNRICESVNPTPTTNQQVESGNVCGTSVIQSGAQSANSENRSRQQSFQHKLTPQNNKDNIADEPSFSLGLTQEEQIQEDIPILGQTCPHHVQLSQTNVDDNIEGISSSRRSKRQKTVPSGLVEDYLCGPHLLSRAKESQRSIFATLDISELVRKFTNLESKMKSNFVINVSGLAVSRREILQICERQRNYTAKVVDILIRVLRSVILDQLPSEGSHSAEFLDSKFGAAIMKNFVRFLKSKNKESYIFPKSLSGIFPTKEAPKVNPRKYYFPLNVGNKHWVGICFDAVCGTVTILDSCLALHKQKALEKIITPVIQTLPYLARYASLDIDTEPVIQCYDVARPKSVAQIKNEADSGLMSLLFMARHALYGPEACKNIGDDVLMAIPLSVTLHHGAWRRADDGHWTFHRNPSDLGYTVMVKPTETVQDLETIIRERYNFKPETPMVLAYHLPEWMLEPEGTRTPPITLTTTPQVETMMQIRSWWSELKLCVTSGAENVAHYQFLSQTTFTISGATFVFKGYNDKELLASKEVLEECFKEEEMVPIYRVHLEIEKAKSKERGAQGLPSMATEAEGSGSSPSGSQG